MKYTTNYKFKKPEGTEPVNFDDINDSFDLIDETLRKQDDILETESVTRKVSNRKPTATDDETQNIKQGDIWIYENYISEEEYEFIAYQCMDNKARMAKWEKYVEKVTVPPKIYGVRIDENNSNPASAVTYTDDAVGMTAGSSAWDSMAIFKDIKPCVLKNGVVQYYLNPNDFTKKADGSAADITSGNDGDVMIEIPKTGFSITTNGNYINVKVTDNPNNAAFKYYAHSRAAEGDRQKLYIGAYKGYTDDSNRLRSLSGKAPTTSQTIGTFRTQAQANGSGYDILSFYPLTLIQCLYLIKYKNLDSQTALGQGYTGGSAAQSTGATNTAGMCYGSTSTTSRIKLFGIEDFWGNVWELIDGLVTNSTRDILTATTNFNNDGTGYTNNGQGATTDIGNYMSKPQGTTKTGFIAKEVTGSATTHFCDYAALYASCVALFGGSWGSGSYAGAFHLDVDYSAANSSADVAARLMYL